MNILMITNVYTPQIGGVTRSIQQFSNAFRAAGHQALIVAPEYERMPAGERDVIRVPAIPKFYQNQYPLPLPVMSSLIPDIQEFRPDVVHVHHPFLLGTTGQAIATACGVPLVYTHHTRYAVYIETKTNWPRPIEEGILELITGFCELCHGIVAPSEGIADLLRKRGVHGDIEIIPTGVDVAQFEDASSTQFRNRYQLPDDAFLVGHVGRLAKEKNCRFLDQAVVKFLQQQPDARFVAVGDGPERQAMQQQFDQAGLADRVLFTGFLEGQQLREAYRGLDAFAFASHSETQGMVLAEAMAAGVPVVAVQGTGVIDIVRDGENGHLIERDDADAFAQALLDIANADPQQRVAFQQSARATARSVSIQNCAQRMVKFYQRLIDSQESVGHSDWVRLQQRWEAGWLRWKNRAKAVTAAARQGLVLNPATDDHQEPASLSAP